jgi:hypothetical protein
MTIPNMFTVDRYDFRSCRNCGFKTSFLMCVESGWLFKNNQPALGNPRNLHTEAIRYPTPSMQANLENAHESVKLVI